MAGAARLLLLALAWLVPLARLGPARPGAWGPAPLGEQLAAAGAQLGWRNLSCSACRVLFSAIDLGVQPQCGVCGVGQDPWLTLPAQPHRPLPLPASAGGWPRWFRADLCGPCQGQSLIRSSPPLPGC
ncbi:hypothetical protein KIL84_017948 [Mauremys mutica]|uniref:Uncharacterized protein n=1 Tax=Mauremys mutica TaxID=74926 RepID=A0A9D3XPD5_9SAUR|nr:hypothetical protein KIL84_017948 [Mauremys mutica]